jgi:valyl-tRNA synthetase
LAAVDQMNALIEVIRGVRNIRTEANAPMSKQIEIMIKTKTAVLEETLKGNLGFLERFLNPTTLLIGPNVTAPKLAMSNVITDAEIFVPLAELIDLGQEIKRLTKEDGRLAQEIQRIDRKLGNQGFIAKAPAAVVDEQRTKRADYVGQQQAVQARIAELKANQA